MTTNEKRKAKVAIFAKRANSLDLRGLGPEVLDLDSPLLVFVSNWSANDSEATVEALVDDLSLEDIISRCWGLSCCRKKITGKLCGIA